MADKTYIYVGAQTHGLFRKEAADDHWEELTDGMAPRAQAWPIAIDPQAPEVILVGTQRGVYRSQDGGDHWKRADMPDGRIVRSLKINPDNPRVMYAGTEGSEVFRSDDAGESWDHVSSIDSSGAHQETAFAPRILGLAMEPGNTDVMYAGVEIGGVARSFDAGQTWEVKNRQFAGNRGLLDSHGVTVGSPHSDAVFFANRVGVLRSRDRCETWENLHLEAFSDIFYCQGITMAPDDPDTIYAAIGADIRGASGCVLRSTDLGDTWHPFDHGVSAGSTIFGVAPNPTHPEQVYFCTRRGKVFGTGDGGRTWVEHAPLPESAQDVVSIACVSL